MQLLKHMHIVRSDFVARCFIARFMKQKSKFKQEKIGNNLKVN